MRCQGRREEEGTCRRLCHPFIPADCLADLIKGLAEFVALSYAVELCRTARALPAFLSLGCWAALGSRDRLQAGAHRPSNLT